MIVGSVIVVGVVASVAIVLALNWPFTQAAVTKTLEDRFARQVTIHKFHSTYFPPGFVAEGIDFLHRERKDLPPLISVQTLTVRAGYSGLLRIHKLINNVQVAGLHIRIPPKSADSMHQTFPLTNSVSGKTLTIGEITTDNAVLEFLSNQPAEDRFTLRIDHLTLDHPVTYHARFNNTEPPGEIRSDGRFGPWNDDDPGSTQLSGSYSYEHANLGFFQGIAGTLSSRGKFGGTLGHINADGNVDIPDFHVAGDSHQNQLNSNFQAVVDGTNGDTWLDPVDATMNSSHFTAKGQIVRVLKTGDDGRLHSIGHDIALTVNVGRARIEDFLRLATDSPVPLMDGDIEVKAQLHIPPGHVPVSQRLALKGKFVLNQAEFSDLQVQKRIRELSLRGQGRLDQLKSAEDDKIKSHIEGDFALDGGVLTLPSVLYSVPGADIHLHGTYHQEGGTLDFTGTAKMQATISKMVGGWKGLLLKPADRFFRKNGAGAEIPIYIAGTREKPKFGYNSGHSGGTHPQRPDTQ